MATAKLTIGMPVYNGRKTIAKSLESVLAQTYADFRIHIHDNCSTDDTEDIVRRFKDPRITYVRNETNLGLVGNHQRCLDACETEYLNIWHDDDVMMPENLEKKVNLLESNRNLGIVFSNVDFIDENDNLHNFTWNEECRESFTINGKDLFDKYVRRMHIGAFFFIGSAISRKSVLNQAGGFNLHDAPLICDSSLFLRALLRTDAACIGESLVKYRSYRDGDSSSKFHKINFLLEHFDVVCRTLYEHKSVIPNTESLKEDIVKSFVSQAAHRGIAACGRDDFESARAYMGWIKNVSKRSGWDSNVMGLRIRLLLGPKAAKIYRPLKKKLGTSW
jgi:glycosyltransferase involved in cell wall biosynthesis